MLDNFKSRMQRRNNSISMAAKQQSDVIMDATFMRDPAYRLVTVNHQPSATFDFECDAKYLERTYYSVQGDDVDYLLQLRPHQHIPIGSYVDIPNADGVKERWLVVQFDDRAMFPQYYILKCNWVLKWRVGDVVYKCDAVRRNQNSYNSGVWTDRNFTTPENQTKIWIPTNERTVTLWYNMRILVNDPLRKMPISWNVTKVEDAAPLGVIKLTFAQDQANVEKDCAKNGIADFCGMPSIDCQHDCENCPLFDDYINAGIWEQSVQPSDDEIVVGAIDVVGSPTIRAGGSYKIMTPHFDEEVGKPLIPKYNWTVKTNDYSVSFVCDDDGNYAVGDSTIEYTQDGNHFVFASDDFGFETLFEDGSLRTKCAALYSMVGTEFDIDVVDGSQVYTANCGLVVTS